MGASFFFARAAANAAALLTLSAIFEQDQNSARARIGFRSHLCCNFPPEEIGEY
jgi:hypothetical protein